MQKAKKCKGIGKAHGFKGCGESVFYRKYGLCASCLSDWIDATEEGQSYLKSIRVIGVKRVKKEEKAKHREQKRALNISGAMRLADTYFSRYIRLFHSVNSECTCYTCGKIKPIKEVDNGHYQKREHKATRYHEDNCRPQCKTCNGDIKHNGKQDVFRVNLVNEIGEKNVAEVERLAKSTIKANVSFYRNIADTYREKVNEIQKILKVKIW